MDDIPINFQFVPIKVCQFRKCTSNLIFNEANQIPKDIISAADIM